MEIDHPNCWEICKCGLEKNGINCEQYGECAASEMQMGHSCWIIAGSLHDGIPFCPEIIDKRKHCSICEVFTLYNRTNGSKREDIEKIYLKENELYKQTMNELNIRRQQESLE
jgi:hypothetical protein